MPNSFSSRNEVADRVPPLPSALWMVAGGLPFRISKFRYIIYGRRRSLVPAVAVLFVAFFVELLFIEAGPRSRGRGARPLSVGLSFHLYELGVVLVDSLRYRCPVHIRAHYYQHCTETEGKK